jgi:hypothetical protein
MKRLFTAALALLIAASAFGQSYPSPTYNNLTVQGTATVNNAIFNGTFTATGKIGLANLASQAANTLVGNATGSIASPTAITVTGCNGAAQALQWTNGTGFGCNSGIATSGANANITSLTGLTTPLSVGQGGTGRQTLTKSAVLIGETTSAINQVGPGTTGQMLLGVTSADPVFGNNPTITGGTIDGAVIGGATPAAGTFSSLTTTTLNLTNLSVSGTVSGAGFTNYLASPPAIGGTAANAGSFTTLSATGNFTPSQTNGIVGTTTNNNANAGSVGEFVTQVRHGVERSKPRTRRAVCIQPAHEHVHCNQRRDGGEYTVVAVDERTVDATDHDGGEHEGHRHASGVQRYRLEFLRRYRHLESGRARMVVVESRDKRADGCADFGCELQ